jgi:hypothetical protein
LDLDYFYDIIDDIIDVLKADHLVLYADDCTIFTVVSNKVNLQSSFDRVISKLNTWLNTNGITLNVTKSNCVVFTRKRNVNPITVMYNNCEIPLRNVVKIFGFDYRH